MLEYNTSSKNTKFLAEHYAAQVGGQLLVEFMSGRAGVANAEEARRVLRGFWAMTDLAVEDFGNDLRLTAL